jgi:hypothetical protein
MPGHEHLQQMTTTKDALLALVNRGRDAVAALWSWLGIHNEQIKILFAVVAALWILAEYKGKQEDARIERTVYYIKRSESPEWLAADLAITKYWLDDDHRKQLAALPKGDQQAYADLIISAVDMSLTGPVWTQYNFHKNVAICVNTNQCDLPTACKVLQREMAVFVGSYFPYFKKYDDAFSDDSLKPLNQMLNACKELQKPPWWQGGWWR